MAHLGGLLVWEGEVSRELPELSKPQARVLAWWSFGIALTRSCGRLTVASFLALLLGVKVSTLEQRLYEWCLESEAKAGRQRREVEVERCFVPLLRWIVRLWQSEQLALTLDATSLSDRFVVLAVSVVYRGIGIPVAWKVLPAGQPGAWRREWLRLLRLSQPAIPPQWQVIVITDRGLFACWLFRRIVRLGWHPFLRVNRGTKFRQAGTTQWRSLSELCPAVGHSWQGRGTAVKDAKGRLDCTLLAWWGDGYRDPWLILTDLIPSTCEVTWYGLRAWCEQGFKCTKRGGWQWQQTQMRDPQRAARLWLALAVAMLWMVSLGTPLDPLTAPPSPTDDALLPLPTSDISLPDLAPLCALVHSPAGTPKRRCLRLFRLGWLRLLVQLISDHPLPLPAPLSPDPWPPALPPPASDPSPPFPPSTLHSSTLAPQKPTP